MKAKILVLFLIAGLTSLFSSCEGPMGPPGVGTRDVFTMEVAGDHWEWDSERECYFYYFNEPAITKLIAEEGLVEVVKIQDGAYHPLVNVRHLYDGIYVTETVSYEYGIGWIRFNFSASDLFDETPLNYKPATHNFKVTLLW